MKNFFQSVLNIVRMDERLLGRVEGGGVGGGGKEGGYQTILYFPEATARSAMDIF
jgi:hypothetical protein